MTPAQIDFIKLILSEFTITTPFFIAVYFVVRGIKCLLRDRMLDIYYANKDTKKIQQYRLESFIFLYKAYKALKGNSFIDKIYKEIMEEWAVEI